MNYDQMWTDVYGEIQDRGPCHRHLRRLVSRILQDLDYKTVLDVGCGPGKNIPLLTNGKRLCRVTGIDISQHAIARARISYPGDFYVLDIEKEALVGCWDLVFCSLVLEHLRDDMAALKNLREMTGEYLLIATIGGNFERYKRWEERMGHVRNYSGGSWKKRSHPLVLK